jgi:hypothetical protein
MRSTYLWVAAVLVAGCSQAPSHSPYASSNCTRPPCGVGSTIGGQKPPPGSDAGTSSLGNGTLAGNVSVFQDATFSLAQPFSGEGTVDVFVGSAPSTSNEVTFSGSNYSASGVPSVSNLWAGIMAPGTTDLMPTLMPIGFGSGEGDVAYARPSVLGDIFGALLQNPQSLLSSRAQLIVKFVDASGSPRAGVEITQAPPGADVAYDSGSLYTDVTGSGGTQGRGTAAILNGQAALWPGAAVTLTYQYGSPATIATFSAVIAQGATTVTSVQAN